MANCAIFVTNMDTDGADLMISLMVLVDGNPGPINAAIAAVVPIGSGPVTINQAIRDAAMQAAEDAQLSVGPLDQKLLFAGTQAL